MVSIALAVGLCASAFSFWQPFLPLYLLDLGAKDETNALFWVSIAVTVQGVARLLSSPIWGVLSDRFGRKMMFLRALYFGTATTLIMVFVTEPWQVTIAFACQGLFSGFVPASVALTSVTVADSRLNSSLSLVTGAQYLGNTIGPAIGAILAIAFGYQGAILLASLMPAVIGTAVIFFVPTDRPAARQTGTGKAAVPLEPFRPNLQFLLAVFTFFVLFSITQLLRLVTPIAIKDLSPDHVEGLVGVTFTLGGLASAVSVLVLARHFFRTGHLKRALVTASILAGLAHLLLSVPDVMVFLVGFVLIAFVMAAMIPATNTLIASNISRERRGTAFGIASSAQALAFMTGPLGAAMFGAISLGAGFAVMGAILVGLGVILLVLREPTMERA